MRKIGNNSCGKVDLMSGKVTLVGAGTGRAGLMTLDGLTALSNADVVVYDRLLGEGIDELIPETAEKIDAGKNSGNHTLPQHEINKLLISRAKEGKNVVRLKGGDGYLFGRGGEEAEALFDADIPFSVISGVTSAISAPAYAGIPVTHREYSSSLHIMTGHNKSGDKPDINFKACAESGGTLVFLMGLKNLSYIAKGLTDAGMSASMPCAVIENGASPMQKKVIASLGDISQRAGHLKSPCVIVVGEVCRLSDKLDTYSRLPLKGISIIIARPYDRARELARGLRKNGACVSIVPGIKINTLYTPVCGEILKHDTVLFTSPAGVNSAFELIFRENRDSRILGGKTIGAVGKKTASELLKYGIKADIIPSEHSGRALAEAVCQNGCKNILLLGAKTGAEGLTEAFEDKNIKYGKLAVYSTEILNVTDKNADYIVFASPSEVKGFSRNGKYHTAVCIGKTTLAEAEKQGFECIVSKSADSEGIISAILNNEKERAK